MEPQFDLTPFNNGYKIEIGGKLCLEFEFIEDGTVLYISKVFKCGDGKPLTRDMIKMIENWAKTIQDPPWSLVKYIKLEDNSSIHVCTVDIDLRYLKILTTGESWYNSFGYKSLNHDANVAHNAVIINKPMDELLSELYDKKYIEKFKERFPELSTDLTVNKYVTAMSNRVPRSGTRTCAKDEKKRARLLFNLVDCISKEYHGADLNPYHLKYDFRLQKKVERGREAGGGAKRTLRKSRRKPRKTRTRKCIKRKTA